MIIESDFYATEAGRKHFAVRASIALPLPLIASGQHPWMALKLTAFACPCDSVSGPTHLDSLLRSRDMCVGCPNTQATVTVHVVRYALVDADTSHPACVFTGNYDGEDAPSAEETAQTQISRSHELTWRSVRLQCSTRT